MTTLLELSPLCIEYIHRQHKEHRLGRIVSHWLTCGMSSEEIIEDPEALTQYRQLCRKYGVEPTLVVTRLEFLIRTGCDWIPIFPDKISLDWSPNE